MSNSATSSFPLLIGDIGGTNTRFAILEGPGGPLRRLPPSLTAHHATPIDAIGAALGEVPAMRPRAAFLAVAARVDGPVARLTNAGWTIDIAAVGERFGFQSVQLVNDYVPVAAALTTLSEQEGDLLQVGPAAAPPAAGARIVLGPGTGFGAAALLPAGEQCLILSTEAGHADFGPATEEEAGLWPLIERVEGRVTAETVLSGPGLFRLYCALSAQRRQDQGCTTPADVSEAALAGTDDIAVETLQWFARLLGRYAGDLALIFGASAVYVGGGIAPRIARVLQGGGFRAAFERKAVFGEWMKTVPTYVIAEAAPALRGLAVLAAQPTRFAYRAASWAR